MLLSVVIPSLEYGSEVWEGNKSQAAVCVIRWWEAYPGALQRHAMRESGGIWVLIHYRAVGIKLS